MTKLDRVEVERTTLRVLIARVTSEGDFVLSGHESLEAQDIGDAESHYAGDSDYMRTVSAEYKDTMLLWLVKERFETDSEFDQWLTDKEIPSRFKNVDGTQTGAEDAQPIPRGR